MKRQVPFPVIRKHWMAFLLALLGVIFVIIETRYGPGASGDSSSYLMGAQNFLAGHGFYRFSGGYELKPITGFPPFFSLVLAGAGWVFHGLYTASRWLNAFLLGGTILGSALLVERYTRSPWAAAAAALLILASANLIVLHAWVMSEPLYIFLSLGFIWLVSGYWQDRSLLRLTLAGAVGAAAILTRYAGLSLVLGGSAVILAFGSPRPLRRLAHAVYLGIVSCVPFVLWTQRNAVLAGTRVDRQLAFHPMDPGLVKLFLATISSWFVPNNVPLPTAVRAAIAIVLAVGITGLFIWFSVRRSLFWDRLGFAVAARDSRAGWILPWMIFFYLAAYALVLFVNSTFLDASTTSTAPARYLAPAYVSGVIFMVCAAHDLLKATPFGRLRTLVPAILVVFVVGFNLMNVSTALGNPLPYIGYTAWRIQWPATVDALQKAQARGAVISNNPEIVYILTGKPAYVRPILYDQYQQQARQDYDQQMAQAKRIMAQGGVFVVFDEVEQDDANLIQAAHLVEALSTPHARFYTSPGEPFTTAAPAKTSLLVPGFRGGGSETWVLLPNPREGGHVVEAERMGSYL